MARTGLQSLGDFSITTAASYVGDWVTGFECILGLTAQFRFVYGSGGTSAKAYLQTTLDDDEDVPIDIACVVFGTASEVAVINLSGLTPKTTQVNPSDGALADDTAIDGVLGDRFRVKIVTSGTYAGSTVCSIRVNPR
jgi:hypothetical protein